MTNRDRLVQAGGVKPPLPSHKQILRLPAAGSPEAGRQALPYPGSRGQGLKPLTLWREAGRIMDCR